MNKSAPIITDIKIKYPSLSMLDDISVSGNKNQRTVVCFCGQECKVSLVPHLREKHPDIWAEWSRIFIELKNLGFNAKKIINIFRVQGRFLFSWNIVEREILGILEKDPSLLTSQASVKTWEPKDFKLEDSTIWSFPTRGSWAVHKNDYRGNWPPELVRNVLLKYTQPGDTVLDVFAGGGTTLIESWLLGRKSFGIDISPVAKKICASSISTMKNAVSMASDYSLDPKFEPMIILGDSRNCCELLSSIRETNIGGIDLVFAHPPYLDALAYSKNIEGELSSYKRVDDFLNGLEGVISSAKNCLKNDGRIVLLIGDVRKKGNLIPLGFLTVNIFGKLGIKLDQIIIKAQHKDTSTNLYKGHESLDYLIAHEYLLVGKKQDSI